ncbi:NAD(P)-dependent alcohol dehydrogenase [Occultella aeris]|uniref:Sorbitol dehydrogenase n=1 Tax=Occultella aeris TaxID=2761496 RepID=A0A7M4DIM3_9MICO|nr:NAD(P)-dependent alcohol dehydrogenase [Occultella aeris]VZO36833.1 Sorbitol dehydrogenase [Occultella aeris]
MNRARTTSPTQLPTTMRAAFLDGPRTIVVRETPVPTPGEFDVLVALTAVGLCGSDVHFYEHGRVGDLVVEKPLILGHEATGVIAAVGPGVSPERVGERVAVEPQRPCRRCHYCRTGRYNLCPDMEFGSAPPVDGAFAQYLVAPADFAHPVPDEVSDAAAALVEPLSVGIAAVRKAGVVPGSSVLIAGAGPIGILTAVAARAFGATEVIVSDPLPTRRAIALTHGATAVLDPVSDAPLDGVVTSFIDASGNARAIDAGLRALAPDGRAVLVGMGVERIDVDLFLLQSRELTIDGLFRYVDTWPTAIKLAASGAIDLDALVSGTFGLDDLAQAIARNGDADVMKFLIDPRR